MSLAVRLLCLLPVIHLIIALPLQSQDVLPEISPVRIQPLNGENDPSQYAYRNLIIDEKGRLWMKTIGVAEQLYALQVYQFDGYNRWLVKVARDQWEDIRGGYLEDFNTDGLLYGYLNDDVQQSALYTLNVETNEIDYTPVPEGIVGSIEEYEPGKFWVLEKTSDAFNVYDWDTKQLHLYFSIPNDSHYRGNKGFYKFADTDFIYADSTLWILDSDFPLIAFDIPSKSVKRYYRRDFLSFVNRNVTYEENRTANKNLGLKGDSLYVVQNTAGRHFYVKDLKKESSQFTTLNILPENTRAHSTWKDNNDNLLFLYEYTNVDHYTMGAILMDASNRLYDYSAMVRNVPRIRCVEADDFKQQAYFGTSNGAYFVQARSKKAITTYENMIGLRYIQQIGKDEFLVRSARDWFNIIKKGEVLNLPENSCINDPTEFKGRIAVLTDPQGRVWLKSGIRMIQYAPSIDGSCVSYSFDTEIKLAAFLSDEKLALIEEESNRLMIYHLSTQESEPVAKDFLLKGVPHHMYVAPDNILWVATNKGLYKINWVTKEIKHYGDTPDFEDDRILVIYDDQEGHLWLGTVDRGIHVFDVNEEKVVKVIDVSDGLSNNVVVGILQDDDGAIWASTYNGLNLIQESGENITIFKEEDGLTHNEFNRHSYFKAEDGRLLFGALEGLNIIDPQKVKKALQSSENTKLYVSQLSYFDGAEDRVVNVRNYQPGGKKLKLPADKRFLIVNVGASNYGLNEKNRYAYRLKGIDPEWTYIGTEHFIRLPNLPPGKYNLEISGIDHNGNRCSNIIRIPIHAKEFFYKQAWFYILLAMPFFIFGILWVRRLNREKDTLEKEVNKRTIQIRKDKELIEQQANELKQLDKMKSRFFANISHDFRTPLTLITGPIELIEQDKVLSETPRIRQTLRSVLQNGKKMLNLVDEMLDLARVESNQIKLHEEEVMLYPYCESIFMSYQAAAQHKHIKYQLNYHADQDYCLITDPRRLEKILNNLIGNAFKFTADNGAISFEVSLKQNEVWFEVQDSGRGIPADDLPHIFDRYFQSQQEDLSTSTGSGIGLSLSLELARLMGGDIRVESRYGHGSTFALSLPARGRIRTDEAEVKTDLTLPDTAVYLDEKKVESNGVIPKILVVEDNLEVQEFIKSLLIGHYKVITKDNGLDALNFLKANKDIDQLPIDLILSDINMPKMNGYELLAAIKEDSFYQQVPVIMLTARIQDKSKFKALRMGVDDYLTKPFSPTEVLLRINNLLANYQKRQIYKKKYQVAPKFEEAVSADQAWLEALEKVMLKALDKKVDINIAYLSDAMAISERQLSRKVKLLTGLTIGKYIQAIKLQKARHLLENRIINSVSEASYLSGFNSPGYFTKVYQKYYGKNPSIYLQER